MKSYRMLQKNVVSRYRRGGGNIKGLVRMATRRKQKTSNTNIEKAIKYVLETNQIRYLPQYKIGPYSADFYLPDYKLVVECDGDYWHTKPRIIRHGIRRDAFIRSKGYKIVHLLGSDILRGPSEALRRSLQNLRKEI